jgi:hypothetical protein
MHFVVLVLTEIEPTSRAHAESIIEDAMAQYSENRNVEPYEDDCFCVKDGEADSNCTHCKGKGTYESTCNPNGKHDWYEIGGRWTGLYSGYDPAKDEKNYETCIHCKGTGKRNDAVGKKARKNNPEYKCNGCDGTGRSRIWNNKPHDGDIIPVEAVLDVYEKAGPPYAVLTSDGQWVEKEDVYGDRDANSSWGSKVKEILKFHRGATAVVVDCHC